MASCGNGHAYVVVAGFRSWAWERKASPFFFFLVLISGNGKERQQWGCARQKNSHEFDM